MPNSLENSAEGRLSCAGSNGDGCTFRDPHKSLKACKEECEIDCYLSHSGAARRPVIGALMQGMQNLHYHNHNYHCVPIQTGLNMAMVVSHYGPPTAPHTQSSWGTEVHAYTPCEVSLEPYHLLDKPRVIPAGAR